MARRSRVSFAWYGAWPFCCWMSAKRRRQPLISRLPPARCYCRSNSSAGFCRGSQTAHASVSEANRTPSRQQIAQGAHQWPSKRTRAKRTAAAEGEDPRGAAGLYGERERAGESEGAEPPLGLRSLQASCSVCVLSSRARPGSAPLPQWQRLRRNAQSCA